MRSLPAAVATVDEMRRQAKSLTLIRESMRKRLASIEAKSGSVHVHSSTLDNVVVHFAYPDVPHGKSAKMHLSVEETCDFASVLLAACRTEGPEGRNFEPNASEALLALAERLRSDQQNLTPHDLRLAAGYLELLLKFSPGDALNGREE